MLKIGWATRDFTPSRPAMLQGQMHVRIARSARDPLTLTAWALEDPGAGAQAVMVSMDVAYVSDGLLAGVRERVRRAAPDFPVGAIVLSGTHTHTSLVFDGDFYPPAAGDVMTQEECCEWIAEHAARAVLDAWAGRRPGRIGRAFGHAVVGHNRYAVYAGGSGRMYGATNGDDFDHIGGYEDHGMDMIFTWTPDGALSGVALAIPCPSQVEEHLEEFSADYWHEVRRELRARLGAGLQVFPICSAAGDQSPHFLVYGREEAEMRRRRGVSERQEIALRVADAVERALVCTTPLAPAQIGLEHSIRKLKLTALRITADHSRWAEESLRNHRKWAPNDEGWYPRELKRVIRTWKQRGVNPPFPMELHVLRIGDAVLATNPFELFLDYGLQIKARSPAPQTILMQLAGRGMYLPTAQALGAGGYGANPVVSYVGPEGGHELVEATLAAIRRLVRVRR